MAQQWIAVREKFKSIPEVAKYVKEWKKRKKEDIYV
jgi:hypothetical protein